MYEDLMNYLIYFVHLLSLLIFNNKKNPRHVNNTNKICYIHDFHQCRLEIIWL